MKIPKEIPFEQLTEEEKKIKNAGGIITEQSRKKAEILFEAIQKFNKNILEEGLDEFIFEILKIIESRYKQLSNKR